MGRHNDIVRSLEILSKAQGWDPHKMTGDVYRYNENRLDEGDGVMPIPAEFTVPAVGPQIAYPGPTPLDSHTSGSLRDAKLHDPHEGREGALVGGD